jgi:hypothetical protein
MRGLLQLVNRFLARHPSLRRKIVNAVYRIPVLDMRLRAALDQREVLTWRRLDVDDLPEDVQVVYERLRKRVKHP